MTDRNTSNSEKRFVDVQPTFVTNPQATEWVQPTDRAFNDPSKHTQSAAVIRSSFGDFRLGPHFVQRLTIWLTVIRTIGVKFLKTITRCPEFTLDRRHFVDQVQPFGHVVTVGLS